MTPHRKAALKAAAAEIIAQELRGLNEFLNPGLTRSGDAVDYAAVAVNAEEAAFLRAELRRFADALTAAQLRQP